jgi:hypothetical protein
MNTYKYSYTLRLRRAEAHFFYVLFVLFTLIWVGMRGLDGGVGRGHRLGWTIDVVGSSLGVKLSITM